jgi:hypothetical protein
MASRVSTTAFVQKLSDSLLECRSAFWDDEWPHEYVCACSLAAAGVAVQPPRTAHPRASCRPCIWLKKG